MIRRLLIFVVLVAALVACGKRSTSISVTDPRTGAENALEHESDTRRCGEQKRCD